LAAIAVAALHGSAPPYFDIAGAVVLVPLVALVIYRAARISIDADENCVVIRNQYRTWVLPWNEVEKVERSSKPAPFGSRDPAILFRMRSGKKVKAQAVSTHVPDQEDVLRQLGSLAPRDVVVLV
jgi:hypothetical protein